MTSDGHDTVENGRRTPRKRVRLDAEDRSEQIATAAKKLFADRPYESVSTAEIAAAAGTTRTNIYHHFQTKSQLFLSIIEEFTAFPVQLLKLPSGAAFEVVVAEAFRQWLDTVDANREMFATAVRARYSADPTVRGVYHSSMESWAPQLHQLLGTDTGCAYHRAMVRSYQALVSEATAQWILEEILDKSDVHALLTNSLLAVKNTVSAH